jgi:O-antigen/teichoic acid export membrane protein
MENKYKRLLKNTGLIAFGGLLTRAFSFLMLPLYTRWLSPSEYGTTDIVSVYASLLTGLITLCIADAMFVFPKNATEENRRKYYTSAYVFTTILFVIAAFFFGTVRYWMICKGLESTFTKYTWFIYAIIATTFLQTITQQFTIAIDRIQVYSFTGLVYASSLAILSFLLIPSYYVKGYMYAMLFANLVAISYTFFVSGSYKYIDYKSISFAHYREMLKYSIPLVPNAIMWWMVSGVNRPLLEANVSLDDIGIYAVAQKLPSIISMVLIFFSQSWQISVMEEYGKESFGLYFNKVIKLSCILLFTIAAAVFLFGDFILHIVTTEQFYSASEFLPYLCAGVAFSGLSGQFGSIYSATKTTKYLFYSSVWGALIAVVSNFILIPQYGVMGAVLSTLFSFMAMSLTRAFWCNKFVRIEKSLMTILIVALVYLLAVIMSYVIGRPLIVMLFYLALVSALIFVDKDLKSGLYLITNKLRIK